MKGYGTLSAADDRNGNDSLIELDPSFTHESASLLGEQREHVDYEKISDVKQKPSVFSPLKLPSIVKHKLFDDTSLSFKKGAIKEYEFFKDDTPVCEGLHLCSRNTFCARLPTQVLVIFLLFIVSLIMGSLATCFEILMYNARKIPKLIAVTVPSPVGGFFLNLLHCCGLLLLSCLITQFIGPNAKGSGIPEMKVLLSGYWVQGYLSVNTLITKIFGLASALASLSMVGREGPFVHLSSMVSYQTVIRFGIFHKFFKSTFLLREILTTSIAVGVSATYGSIFGAIMFSIETTSTYYEVRNYYFSFGAATMTTLVFNFWYNLFRDRPFGTNIIPVTGLGAHSDSAEKINISMLIVAVFIGLVGGLFGIIITKFYRFVNVYRAQNPDSIFLNAYIYALFVGTVTTLGSYSYFVDFPNFGGFLCLNNTFNSNSLFHGSMNAPTALTLLTIIKLILFIVATGLQVPFGVVGPSLVLGSLMGYTCAIVYNEIFAHSVTPCMMAVVGAGAVLAGVTHTLSAAAIVVEMTGEYSLIFPCAISTIVAVGFAKQFSTSYFQAVLDARKLPYLSNLRLSTKETSAHEIAVPHYPVLDDTTTLGQLRRLVTDYSEQQQAAFYTIAFPILGEHKKLLGSISLKHIKDILEHVDRTHSFIEGEGGTPSESDSENYYAVLVQHVDVNVFTVNPNLELYKLHACFVTLRLHYVYVVHGVEGYQGIITRDQVMKIAENSANPMTTMNNEIVDED